MEDLSSAIVKEEEEEIYFSTTTSCSAPAVWLFTRTQMSLFACS